MQVFFQSVVEQKCEGLMVKLLESGEGLEGEDAVDEDAFEGKKGKGKKGKEEEEGQEAASGTGKSGGKKKPLPATYEPDQRSQGWLKVKKGECTSAAAFARSDRPWCRCPISR